MRKTVIVASVFVVASVAMPSMAQAKDDPKPPFGHTGHIGKCKGHVVKPDVTSKGHGEKTTEAPATSEKSDKGLNNRVLEAPGLNNKSLITGLIIRCR
jgi:hypothetical protein